MQFLDASLRPHKLDVVLLDLVEQRELSVALQFEVRVYSAFLRQQLVELAQLERGLDQLKQGDKRLVFFVQDFEQEFYKQLYVGEALAEVKYLEFVILVLPSQLI